MYSVCDVCSVCLAVSRRWHDKVCIFGASPIPMSAQLPVAVAGIAQQLQGCSLQQRCPYTTHYLTGFSLSRCYSRRRGVKLRCKERPDSIGSLCVPLFMISLQNYTAEAKGVAVRKRGSQHHVPRVCMDSFPLVTNARQKVVKFH